MKKVFQLVTIGLAAYNLYVVVNRFLETPSGEKVKEKVEPYITEAVEAAKGYAEDATALVQSKINKV